MRKKFASRRMKAQRVIGRVETRNESRTNMHHNGLSWSWQKDPRNPNIPMPLNFYILPSYQRVHFSVSSSQAHQLNTEGQCSVTPGRLGRRVSAKGFPKIKGEEGMTFREARSLSSFLSFLSTCKQCGIRHEELQTKILAITATSADSDQTLDQSMKSFESEVPYFENVLCQCCLDPRMSPDSS